jgi:hypothetical protein
MCSRNSVNVRTKAESRQKNDILQTATIYRHPNEIRINITDADSLAAPRKQAPTTPPPTHWPPQENKHPQHRRRLIGRPKKTSTTNTAAH